MDTHVKVLAILNVVGGALGLLGALVVLLVFGGVVASVSGDADAASAIPVIGLTGIAVVVFLACWSLPGVIVGIGLYRLRPWARIGGIVVSVLALIAFPFGTMLGAYGLWVLFSKDTEQLFAGRVAAT
jgi:hypothetical protein